MSGSDEKTTDASIRVRCWGTRGSLPVSGPKFSAYGGNTVCTEIRCGPHTLLFDAGSGILPAGKKLTEEGVSSFNIFFSHSHYDHIIGLPFFAPFFVSDTPVKIWSGHLYGNMSTEQMINEVIRPPWFPVTPDIFRADISCNDFKPGDDLHPHPGMVIKTGNLNHIGGAVGYRVEWGGRSVAIITDTEHTPGSLDPEVLALIEDCDLFLYDSHLLDSEMEEYRGYGHSTWQQAIRLARKSGSRKVGFIHHATWRTDTEIKEFDLQAKAEFPESFFARDGQIIDM